MAEVRLIDANAFKRDLIDNYGFFPAMVMRALEKQPTIDPENLRPKGRWILKANKSKYDFKWENCVWEVEAECPVCHHEKGKIHVSYILGFSEEGAKEIVTEEAKKKKLDNFCPNCGADMREV